MGEDMGNDSASTGNGDLLAQAMRQVFKDVNEDEAEALQVDARETDCPNEASGKDDG